MTGCGKGLARRELTRAPAAWTASPRPTSWHMSW